MSIASLTALTIYFAFYPEQATVVQVWDHEALKDLNAAISVAFLVCIIGNLLPVPTPYSFVVWFAGVHLRAQNPGYPAIVALVASVGCFVGEMAGYFIGRGAAEVVKGKEFRTIQKLQDLLAKRPRLAPALIFLFGLTPLNDDMLTVPLGFIKYSVKKTVLFMWLGKLGMMLVLAYLPFNLPGGEEAWWVSMLSLYLVVLSIYLIVKVDLFELFGRVRARFSRVKEKQIPGAT